MFGHQLLLPIPDLDRTSYLLVLGANPMASNGSLMTAPDFPNRAEGDQAARRTDRGARPAPHRDRGDRDRAPLRPAGRRRRRAARDAAGTILAEGLATPPAYVDGLDELRALVDDFTPALAEQVSAVPAETVERLARELCETRGAAAYGRLGVSATGFGSVSQWAINCLNLLAGDFDRPGGVMFPEPAVDVVGRRFVGTGHFDLCRSRVRGLPEYGGELPAAVHARGDRDARRRADPGDRHASPATRCSRRPTAAARRGPRLRSTSWSRSTSTSTRRPGTPT